MAKRRKKGLVGYAIKRWKGCIKLLGDKPNRYYDFPEIGEKPMEGLSEVKVKMTIERIK